MAIVIRQMPNPRLGLAAPLFHSGLEVPLLPGQDPMKNLPPRPVSEPAELSQSLTDRVAERVINARLTLEGEPSTKRSSTRRPRRSDTTLFESKNDAELRETQSLKRVFREMGHAYRRYRKQTGGPVVPGLRDAAYRFRAEPSLPALVAVAAYLDELDLLS